MQQQMRLTRSSNRVFGGVCAGLAQYIGLSIGGVRLLMLLFILFGGLSLWVYLALWILVPADSAGAPVRDMGCLATVLIIFATLVLLPAIVYFLFATLFFGSAMLLLPL